MGYKVEEFEKRLLQKEVFIENMHIDWQGNVKKVIGYKDNKYLRWNEKGECFDTKKNRKSSLDIKF